MKQFPVLTLFVAASCLLSVQSWGQTPVDATFTYQGQLKRAAVPVSDACDFEFRLYNAVSDGTQIGATRFHPAVPVENGLFSVALDFGASAFNGDQRFLEVAVECPGDGALTTLSPRHALTATPYAATALSTVGIDGHSLDASDGSPTDAVRVDAQGKVLMNKGGLNVFDNVGHGISLTSDSFTFTEGTSEDPVYGYSSSSDTHAFYTSGTRQVVISDVGNVGIGMGWNESPAAKLHIGGNPGTDGVMFPDGTLQTTAASGGGGDSLWSDSGSDIFYTAGNVGIGTSTPAHRLHVVSVDDRAIFGKSTDTSGAGYGVYGEADAFYGHGVRGVATDLTAPNCGVSGQSSSDSGMGVYGLADSASGNTTGVCGQSNSSTGRGVRGMATATSGVNYAVIGEAQSPDGFAGYFVNTSSDGTAVYAESAGAGREDATLQVHNTQATAGMAAYITSVGSWATMHMENDGTGEVLWLQRDNSDSEFIVARNTDTNSRVFSVDHDGWTKASMLEITGEVGVDGLMFADGTVQTTAAVGGSGDSLWSDSGGDIFYTAGNVGIGTSNPTEKLHVAGDAQVDDNLGIGIAPAHTMKLRISGDSTWGLMSEATAVGGQAIWGQATATSGGTTGVYGSVASPDGVGVWGEHSATSGDKPAVYGRTSSTANLAAGVKGEALSAASGAFTVGVMGLTHAGLSVGVYGKADYADPAIPTQGGYFESTSSNGIGVHGLASGAGAFAGYFDGRGYFSGDVGIGTSSPDAKLDVAGTARVNVLQIDGGADLSENFAIGGSAEPGMVVVIDSKRPGALRTSSSAYDRRVAGIISGAGGVRTGMLMSQVGSVADGKHPVALTGRVYCRCDASGGAIEPGDMLTTSNTPGHAMKVTDYARAQGAIIGKAMTSLEADSGLVLVLVNLQ